MLVLSLSVLHKIGWGVEAVRPQYYKSHSLLERFITFTYLLCVCRGALGYHVWEVRGQLSGVGTGLRDWTQVIRLCGRRLSLLSHLSSSRFLLNPLLIG